MTNYVVKTHVWDSQARHHYSLGTLRATSREMAEALVHALSEVQTDKHIELRSNVLVAVRLYGHGNVYIEPDAISSAIRDLEQTQSDMESERSDSNRIAKVLR